MYEDILDISIKDIKRGYVLDSEKKEYVCNICEAKYMIGEVFFYEGKYFDAKRMIGLHVKNKHPDLIRLLSSDKYTNLTDNQKKLFIMMAKGMSDREIANENKVASSTIRHQRFILREKAKQAKMFLSIYELTKDTMEEFKTSSKKEEKILDVHKGAKMIDDRYFTTKKEEEKVLDNLFYTLKPLKLKTFSAKEKKKIIILRRIAKEFDDNSIYTQKEVNNIIKEIYSDISTIRRYLIEYGFLDRKKDGSEYWVRKT